VHLVIPEQSLFKKDRSSHRLVRSACARGVPERAQRHRHSNLVGSAVPASPRRTSPSRTATATCWPADARRPETSADDQLVTTHRGRPTWPKGERRCSPGPRPRPLRVRSGGRTSVRGHAGEKRAYDPERAWWSVGVPSEHQGRGGGSGRRSAGGGRASNTPRPGPAAPAAAAPNSNTTETRNSRYLVGDPSRKRSTVRHAQAHSVAAPGLNPSARQGRRDPRTSRPCNRRGHPAMVEALWASTRPAATR